MLKVLAMVREVSTVTSLISFNEVTFKMKRERESQRVEITEYEDCELGYDWQYNTCSFVWLLQFSQTWDLPGSLPLSLSVSY